MLEPEWDVANGRLAARDVRLPPAVGGAGPGPAPVASERLLLLFELDVDDIVGLAAGAAAVGGGLGGRGAARGLGRCPGGGVGGVQVLGHRLAGPLEVLDRLVDRGGVVP